MHSGCRCRRASWTWRVGVPVRCTTPPPRRSPARKRVAAPESGKSRLCPKPCNPTTPPFEQVCYSQIRRVKTPGCRKLRSSDCGLEDALIQRGHWWRLRNLRRGLILPESGGRVAGSGRRVAGCLLSHAVVPSNNMPGADFRYLFPYLHRIHRSEYHGNRNHRFTAPPRCHRALVRMFCSICSPLDHGLLVETAICLACHFYRSQNIDPFRVGELRKGPAVDKPARRHIGSSGTAPRWCRTFAPRRIHTFLELFIWVTTTVTCGSETYFLRRVVPSQRPIASVSNLPACTSFKSAGKSFHRDALAR